MRQVVLSPDAVRQLKQLEAPEQRLLKSAMDQKLKAEAATLETRNRFRLRRPSRYADFELRVRSMRVFYRVSRDRVEVVLIGRKRGNELIIDGKRFML